MYAIIGGDPGHVLQMFTSAEKYAKTRVCTSIDFENFLGAQPQTSLGPDPPSISHLPPTYGNWDTHFLRQIAAADANTHWRQPGRGCREHPQYFGWGTSMGTSSPIYFKFSTSVCRNMLIRYHKTKQNSREGALPLPQIPLVVEHPPHISPPSALRPPDLELALTPLLIHCHSKTTMVY